MATELNEDVEKIRTATTANTRAYRLDAPINADSDSAAYNFIADKDSIQADGGLENQGLNKEIDRAFSTLTERESSILRSSFGIGCDEQTLEEIGEQFGLTRERVRQIREKAIRRLRNTSRSKNLKSYLG